MRNFHLYTINQISSDSKLFQHKINVNFVMHDSLLTIKNQSGSPLIVVVVMLAVIAIAATFASKNSTQDVTVAGIDSLHKLTRSEADGATEMAAELLEQNLACPKGFKLETEYDIPLIKVNDANTAFWQNNAYDVNNPSFDTGDYDFYFPDSYDHNGPFEPHTIVTLGGQSQFALGGAIQMAAGYEGKGKSAGDGGGHILYDIMVIRKSYKDSEAMCRIEWSHVIGREEELDDTYPVCKE